MVDIEPAYTPLISVCRELETPAGSLDNLWITPAGGLVLGECKLARNPQARREVVAQALDYARAVSSWHYEDLERQVRKARKEPDFKLWQLASTSTEGGELDESRFHDSVERRLSAGNLLVLIIGDGIKEGAEALTSFRQLHAGFHAGLALVDLSIWETDDKARLVVPRVPMKTVIVERGVVTIASSGVPKIEPPDPGKKAAIPRAHTASEAEFFEQFQTRHPELVAGLREFTNKLSAAGVTPEFQKSLVLRWMPMPDVKASAGYIDSYGSAWLGGSFVSAVRLNNEDAARRYLAEVAAAVGGSVKYRPNSEPTVVGPAGRTVHIAELLPVQDKWLAAIGEFVSTLSRQASSQIE